MTAQAVERYQDALSPDIVNEREFKALRMQAEAFSKTGLVPKALFDKPDDVLLVMMTAREIGMRPLAAVGGALFPIDGKVGMLAQTMVGLAEAAGHEIWPAEEGDDFCTVAGRRHGSKRVSLVTFTLTQARRMRLLDMWVEKWEKGDNGKWRKLDTYIVGDVIDGLDDDLVAKAPAWARKQLDSGRVKYRESWKKTPTDMLYNRAAARLCRRRFSDALLGLHPYTPDELGIDDDREVEAELVDDRRAPDGHVGDGPEPDDDEIVDIEVVEDEDETPNQGRSAEDASAEGDAGDGSQGRNSGDGANGQDVGGGVSEPSSAREGGDRSAGHNDPGRPADPTPPKDAGDGQDDDRVRAAAPPLGAEPSSAGDREGGKATADAPAPDRAPNSAGGGDSEGGHGKPAASEAAAGNSDNGGENQYARAIHVLAHELGLVDEALDEILHDVCGDVSANAVTKENWRTVVERMNAAGGAK